MELSIFDWLFFFSAVLFNLLIAGIFILQKQQKEQFTRVLGKLWLSLAFPLMVAFIHSMTAGKPSWVLVCFGLVFLYMLVEWMLDFILKIKFRSRWITHAPYILLEYAALFSLIAIAIHIHPTLGWIVSAAFWFLMGSLIYLYASGKRKKKSHP